MSLTAVSTPALQTDLYELTMLDAALADGTATTPCTFEAFIRRLPAGTGHGVMAGTDRLVDAICAFRFRDDQLAWLRSTGRLSERTLEQLAGFRFGGTVHVRAEGEPFTAGSPVVTVDANFAEGVVLETVVLSVLNHSATVATTAAGMVAAAGGHPLIEMGGRRTHEDAAVDGARAAWIAGFEATCNAEAGFRYGIPVTGTAAHAWTLLHRDEEEAFVAQMTALGPATTLLVDTFDTAAGIAVAVRAAHRLGVAGPGAVRIDSGEPTIVVPAARRQLDRLGAATTRILLSGDLDTARIGELVDAGVPVDGFGVGTRLVCPPPLGFVYKLTEVRDGPGPARAVAKTSAGKATVGGAKRAFAALDGTGRRIEVVVPAGGGADLLAGTGPEVRPLDTLAVFDGEDQRTGSVIERTALARRRAAATATELARQPGPLPLHLVGFSKEA